MGFGTTIRNSMVDHFTGKTSWTQPTATYVGLSSTTPTDAGTNVTEPSGGSYARVQVTPAQWDAAASGATSNNAEKTFPQATADWSGGSNQTHHVYYDASSGGNFLGWGALTAAKPILNGDTASFAVGDLDLSIT